MKRVNKQIVDFYENGVFGEPISLANDDTIQLVENIYFENGMKKFLKQLTNYLNEQTRTVLKRIPATTKVFMNKSGLYIFTESEDFIIFSFEENSNQIEKIETLITNIEEIKAKAWTILHREYSAYLQTRNALTLMLTQIHEEKKSEGHFEKIWHYHSPSEEMMIMGEYFHSGYYFRIRGYGLTVTIKKDRDGYDPRILEKKGLDHEEAYQLLIPAIEELVREFKLDAYPYVKNAVSNELVKLHGISENQLRNVVFEKANNDDVRVSYQRVVIPMNVDPAGVAKAAQYIKALDYLDQQSEEVKAVTRYFNINATKDFHLQSGILPETFSIEDAEVLVELIESRLKKVREFIASGTLEKRPNKLPSFAKAFFLRFEHSFDYKGNTFERYAYRLPDNKKTKALMYENGKLISENRYFRILRKYRKQGE